MIRKEVVRTLESRVVCGRHKIMGAKVAIKSIPVEYYNEKAALFAISEADALYRC